MENIKKLYIDGTSPCKLNSDNLRSTNTSGVTGVWFDKSRGLWVSEITFKRKKYFLGRFSDKNDAITIRKEAEKEIFGDFLKWYKENVE